MGDCDSSCYYCGCPGEGHDVPEPVRVLRAKIRKLEKTISTQSQEMGKLRSELRVAKDGLSYYRGAEGKSALKRTSERMYYWMERCRELELQLANKPAPEPETPQPRTLWQKLRSPISMT